MTEYDENKIEIEENEEIEETEILNNEQATMSGMNSSTNYSYGIVGEAMARLEDAQAGNNEYHFKGNDLTDSNYTSPISPNEKEQNSGTASEGVSSMSWNAQGQNGSMSWNAQGQNASSASSRNADNKGGKPRVSIATVVISVVLSLLVGFGGSLLMLKCGDSFGITTSGNNDSIVRQMSKEEEGTKSYKTESIVKQVEGSVVEITTESVQKGTFFGEYIAQGAGSGIIITEDGYVATNDHVISGAKDVKVRLRNGKSYEAKLVGTDAKTDVALLKIEAKGLTAAVFGDSDDLSVGEKAIVIGNPLGELGGTVTEGIISAVDREITIDNQKKNLLQTDASINPGNSGGALFDGKGNVVGMVEAKSSGSDVEGLGFAIPANTVKTVIDELKKNGRVTGRPYLGISMIDIATMQEALQYNVSHAGTYVAQVVKNSAAEKAGLKVGDCVTHVDGEELKDSADLKARVDAKKVGDKITLKVIRVNGYDEEELEIEAVLGEQNDTAESEIERYKK